MWSVFRTEDAKDSVRFRGVAPYSKRGLRSIFMLYIVPLVLILVGFAVIIGGRLLGIF